MDLVADVFPQAGHDDRDLLTPYNQKTPTTSMKTTKRIGVPEPNIFIIDMMKIKMKMKMIMIMMMMMMMMKMMIIPTWSMATRSLPP